jgi:DNA-directed RNA polymerase specialized sigma subunit
MCHHLSFVRLFSAKRGLCPSDADLFLFPPPLKPRQIAGGNEMKNHVIQNQSNERKIHLKDLHQWVPVSKTDYDNYYRDINAYRRRQQEHGCCVCPANKRYLCDMDCWVCRFHKAGDELSLDYTVTDEDGNEKSWLDDLADEAPSAQSILEERELLGALLCKLDELDSNGRRICELLLQDKSEREIAAIMGISQQSTINYKKKKAFGTLRELLNDYI